VPSRWWQYKAEAEAARKKSEELERDNSGMLGLIGALEGAGAAGGELGNMISSGMAAARKGKMTDVSKQFDHVWKHNLPGEARRGAAAEARGSRTQVRRPPVQAAARAQPPVAASSVVAATEAAAAPVVPREAAAAADHPRAVSPAEKAEKERQERLRRAKALEATIKEEDAAEAAKVSSLFKSFKSSDDDDDDGLESSAAGSGHLSVDQMAQDAMGGTDMAAIAAKVDATEAKQAAAGAVKALARDAGGDAPLGDNLADLVNLMKQPPPAPISKDFHPFQTGSHAHLARVQKEVRVSRESRLCAAAFGEFVT